MTALLVGMFAIGNAATADSAAVAAETDPSQPEIVALAFDPGGGILMKAYAGALDRSNSQGRDWQRVAMPGVVNQGRIAAISIAAQGGSLYVAGPGFGVLRSVDGGRSWIAKNDGLPSREIVALSAHAQQPQTVYAYATGHGIFRSQDAGDHWRLMDAGPREKVVQFVHSNMPGSMETGWLFAATAKGVGRSMDCFCGWRDAGALAQRVNAITFDPKETRRVYAATSEAFLVSVDGGEHWSHAQRPGGTVTALVVTPAGVVYAASGRGELLVSADRGNSWRHVDE
ncbi:MAG: hypothetical protein ABI349_11350 [Casimicrobiaceae bacterium]